tara:strand:- start:344 stop:487 length:144 start_codon:yes stop_codon:yes gene_type:complete
VEDVCIRGKAMRLIPAQGATEVLAVAGAALITLPTILFADLDVVAQA